MATGALPKEAPTSTMRRIKMVPNWRTTLRQCPTPVGHHFYVGKSMRKKFTSEEIKYLASLPEVKQVTENKLILTFSFREKLYSIWREAPGMSVIRKTLAETGIPYSLVGKGYVRDLHKNFLQFGAPRNGKLCSSVREENTESKSEINSLLIGTGCFEIKGKGITFSRDYIRKLTDRYPKTSIEDCLRQDGIDPQLVGYQRIYALKRKFEQESIPERRPRGENLTSEQIEAAQNHPYILRVPRKQIVLCPDFYWEAKALEAHGMTITEILQLFELPDGWFRPSSRIRIKYDIRNAVPVNPPDELAWNNSQFVRIQRRRLIRLEQFAAQGYSEIREKLGSSDPETCLRVYEWVRDIPTGEKYQDSLSQILLKLGICRSRFYRMCSDAFKAARKSRMEKEKQDLEAVRKTSEYGGYPKGSRQIYMQMANVANRHMSRRKIRKLMKKAGIVCPVRKANASRQKAREYLKTHVKPNLLRRRFRLNRPGKVFLTDVTYLDYGENQRAYGSACKDSVTGEVVDFTIRSENDLNLVKETLLALPDGQNESMPDEKLILHSDQGVLYLTDEFQNTASSRNLTLSMSKRGNCWDNAPQESFFGHFKDECPYKDCSTLEEVRTAVKEYVIYYNTQRGQWNRNKMTPRAYREYLLNMNDSQFSAWMEEQEKYYAEMKKRAEQRAVERARTLGV